MFKSIVIICLTELFLRIISTLAVCNWEVSLIDSIVYHSNTIVGPKAQAAEGN